MKVRVKIIGLSMLALSLTLLGTTLSGANCVQYVKAAARKLSKPFVGFSAGSAHAVLPLSPASSVSSTSIVSEEGDLYSPESMKTAQFYNKLLIETYREMGSVAAEIEETDEVDVPEYIRLFFNDILFRKSPEYSIEAVCALISILRTEFINERYKKKYQKKKIAWGAESSQRAAEIASLLFMIYFSATSELAAESGYPDRSIVNAECSRCQNDLSLENTLTEHLFYLAEHPILHNNRLKPIDFDTSERIVAFRLAYTFRYSGSVSDQGAINRARGELTALQDILNSILGDVSLARITSTMRRQSIIDYLARLDALTADIAYYKAHLKDLNGLSPKEEKTIRSYIESLNSRLKKRKNRRTVHHLPEQSITSLWEKAESLKDSGDSGPANRSNQERIKIYQEIIKILVSCPADQREELIAELRQAGFFSLSDNEEKESRVDLN